MIAVGKRVIIPANIPFEVPNNMATFDTLKTSRKTITVKYDIPILTVYRGESRKVQGWHFFELCTNDQWDGAIGIITKYTWQNLTGDRMR